MSNDVTGIDSSLNIAILPVESVNDGPSASILAAAIRLKLIREAFGFSQRELAKRAGVTNSGISMIEQGQVSPSIQSLTRILAVFPISLADFFSFQIFTDNYCAQAATEAELQPLSDDRQQLDARVECLSAGQFTAFGAAAVDSCGVVLNGSLQLTLLSGKRLLNQGESFYIPASQPYRLINLSEHDASLFRCSLFVRKG